MSGAKQGDLEQALREAHDASFTSVYEEDIVARLRAALAAARGTSASQSIEYARALNELGRSERLAGNLAAAEAAYSELVANAACAVMVDRRGLAQVYHNLGVLHATRRDFDVAIRHLQKALRLRSSSVKDPGRIRTIVELSTALQEAARAEEAAVLVIAELTRLSTGHIPELGIHPADLQSEPRFARIAFRYGFIKHGCVALDHYAEGLCRLFCARAFETHIYSQADMLVTWCNGTNAVMELAKATPETHICALRIVLLTHAFSGILRRAISMATGVESTSTACKIYRSSCRKLAQAALRSQATGEDQVAARRACLDAEGTLLSTVTFAERHAYASALTVSAIADSLAEDALFVQFHRCGSSEATELDAVYAIFVLRRGMVAPDVRWTGPALLVDATVAALRSKITGADARVVREQPGGEIISLVAVGSPSDPSAIEEAALRLARDLIEPWSMHLRGVRKLVLSVDGELRKCPFELLLASMQGLGLTPIVAYVDTPASFAPGVGYALQHRGPSVVIGDPEFRHRNNFGGPYRHFPPLASSRIEAELVARKLGVEPVLGARATKDFVLRLRSPAVLHIATHGYSAPALTAAMAVTGKLSKGGVHRSTERDGKYRDSTERGIAAAQLDPLLSSGLAFAGAEDWASGFDTDALLTVREVPALDLSSTDLVVLSGCGTALGEAHAGLGSIGLAQALASAGVRAVVGSLWAVGDRASHLFMSFFYDALCAGLAVGSALVKARRETRGILPHPVHWVGWILHGDPNVRLVA